MNELRELRRAADLSQRQLAQLLDIPVNTFRMWASGLRRPPTHVVARTRETLAGEARRHELLPMGRSVCVILADDPSPNLAYLFFLLEAETREDLHRL